MLMDDTTFWQTEHLDFSDLPTLIDGKLAWNNWDLFFNKKLTNLEPDNVNSIVFNDLLAIL